MKATVKLVMILITLMAGWGAMIWMQWSQELAMNINLLAAPIMMLVMAFLAVLAAKDAEIDI